MANNPHKLIELQYEKFLATDANTSEDVDKALSGLDFELPRAYLEFLHMYPNSGIFESEVVCIGQTAAPCAPEHIYPITLLYALSSNPLYNLLQIRENQYDIPLNYLLIGEDAGGNQFALCLDERNFGKIYFLYGEEFAADGHGAYLLTHDFSSFIDSLKLA